MDVLPHVDGWLAVCECSLRRTFADQAVAWTWLVEHDCAALEIPEQRSRDTVPDDLTPPTTPG